MDYLRQAAAGALTVVLCLAGGSAVNAGLPMTPKPVPARQPVVAARHATSSPAPQPTPLPSEPPGTGMPQAAPDGGSPPDSTSPAPPAPPPPSTSVDSTVGALFTMGQNGLEDHFCSASVVHSQRRNLVITAAHCLHSGLDGDYGSNIVFVPAYHSGVKPYGIWPAVRLTVDPRWTESGDPDLDVGFLSVAQPGNPRPIEDVTGGNDFTPAAGFSLPVTTIGYPNDADAPLTCSNSTSRQSTYQLRLDCAGFSPGTSGSPWLINIDPGRHHGAVVGVIGGYQQGGIDSDVSYSSYFDADVSRLYEVASRAS